MCIYAMYRSLLQILLKPKFSGVQKIKTIGSTYMAATGLHKKVWKKTIVGLHSLCNCLFFNNFR